MKIPYWFRRPSARDPDEREKDRRDAQQFWRPGEPRIWTPYGFAKRLYHDKRGMLAAPDGSVMEYEHNFGTVGSTTRPGTSCTTGAAATTKGTPAQLVASTGFDSYYIRLYSYAVALAAGTSRGTFDLLVGAATEDVLVADMLNGNAGGFGSSTSLGAGGKVWEFPLYIPAGTRLAVQACNDRTSTAIYFAYEIYGGPAPQFRVGGAVTSYGIGTRPAGTAVTPGASGAEGSWTQITASSSADHFAFVPSYQPGTDISITPNKIFWLDMGSGAATEEDLLGTENSYLFRQETGEQCEGPWNATPAFQAVPSGTRLVIRLSANGALDTGDPTCMIHGVS